MKAKISAPPQWISLPLHKADQPKSRRTKKVILFTLMIITSCAALFLLTPKNMAGEGKPSAPPAGPSMPPAVTPPPD